MNCIDCGADWDAGKFTAGCATCGGGALERACPKCGGGCGAVWKKAVIDTLDRHEAHWIGHCALEAPAEIPDFDSVEWWLDESALPDLLWAALLERGGDVFVFDCDGRFHRFDGRNAAERWLREDEYEQLSALREMGSIAAEVTQPELFR